MWGIVCVRQGHRGRARASAQAMRRRRVAIECGTWRSGRSGAAAGSLPFMFSHLVVLVIASLSPTLVLWFPRIVGAVR